MRGKRIIITLPEEDKIWLESYSKASQVSVAEAIRQGIRQLKESMGTDTYNTLIQNTRGVWKKGDGLGYQEKIRSEWELR